MLCLHSISYFRGTIPFSTELPAPYQCTESLLRFAVLEWETLRSLSRVLIVVGSQSMADGMLHFGALLRLMKLHLYGGNARCWKDRKLHYGGIALSSWLK